MSKVLFLALCKDFWYLMVNWFINITAMSVCLCMCYSCINSCVIYMGSLQDNLRYQHITINQGFATQIGTVKGVGIANFLISILFKSSIMVNVNEF